MIVSTNPALQIPVDLWRSILDDILGAALPKRPTIEAIMDPANVGIGDYVIFVKKGSTLEQGGAILNDGASSVEIRWKTDEDSVRWIHHISVVNPNDDMIIGFKDQGGRLIVQVVDVVLHGLDAASYLNGRADGILTKRAGRRHHRRRRES